MQREEPMLKPCLNRLLCQARNECRWSQSELAERVEVSKETISRWENGVNKPQPYQLRKLSEVFGKPLEALGYPLEHRAGKTSREDQPHPKSDEASHDVSAPPPFQKSPVLPRRLVVSTMALGAIGLVGGTAAWILLTHLFNIPIARRWSTVTYDLHRHTEPVCVVQWMLKAHQYDIGTTGEGALMVFLVRRRRPL